MDILLRFAALLGGLAAFFAVGLIGIRALIWLLALLDPARPLEARRAARIRAIEATLRAVRLGLVRIPSVFRRQNV
jgi:hypothetical protein